ncbi:hypothetical protein Pelo_3121 [Pelomyxa schiedti]|nr:hypothetical protein Pelo_3121 [Pelomyxa schiedti]
MTSHTPTATATQLRNQTTTNSPTIIAHPQPTEITKGVVDDNNTTPSGCCFAEWEPIVIPKPRSPPSSPSHNGGTTPSPAQSPSPPASPPPPPPQPPQQPTSPTSTGGSAVDCCQATSAAINFSFDLPPIVVPPVPTLMFPPITTNTTTAAAATCTHHTTTTATTSIPLSPPRPNTAAASPSSSPHPQSQSPSPPSSPVLVQNNTQGHLQGVSAAANPQSSASSSGPGTESSDGVWKNPMLEPNRVLATMWMNLQILITNSGDSDIAHSSEITPVASLSPTLAKWTIKVCVKRKWPRQCSSGKYFTADLEDEQGGQILIVGWPQTMALFDNLMQENHQYCISNCAVKPRYKEPQKLELNLLPTSIVKDVTPIAQLPPAHSDTQCNFTPIANIFSCQNTRLNVRGVVLSIVATCTRNTKWGPAQVKTIQLADIANRNTAVRVELWRVHSQVPISVNDIVVIHDAFVWKYVVITGAESSITVTKP